MTELIEAFRNFQPASPLYFWIGAVVILTLIFLPFFKKKGLWWNLKFWEKKVRLGGTQILILSILIVMISLLISVALANPQIVAKRSIPFYGQKPIMMVVDVSGSMEKKFTEDLTSFKRMREAFYDLIERDLGANIGILIYSDSHYIARDFAPKLEFLRDSLENDKEISELSGGTQTAPALRTARVFFSEKTKSEDKSIILFSDLEDRRDWIALEMEACLEAGIRLYVIVVEPEEKRAYAKMDQLKILMGGKGVEIVWIEDQAGINRICQEIKERKSSFTGEIEVLSKKSLLPYLIPGILGLVLLVVILSETIFRKIS